MTTKELSWDDSGKRFYETGVSKGVLYVQDTTDTTNPYPKGVAWNGLINVNENPTGADATPLYADNIKYLNLISREDFEASLDCYTYPDEFAACDGSASIATGVTVGQQTRKAFGLCYRTIVGNDSDGENYGYKLHLIYGATAAPSQKAYATVNDSPEAITFSYSIKTTPVEVGEIDDVEYKPTATITIDSNKVSSAGLAALEAALYGTTTDDPYLPLPAKVIELVGTTAQANG